MNNKTVYEVIYKFKGIEGLTCDLKGNFTYKESPCKKVYNNGTIQIRQKLFSKGIKSLRKLAYKSKIEKEQFPF